MDKKIIIRENQVLSYIKWQDAHATAHWMTEQDLTEEINQEMCIIEEVGWVVYEDEKEIHIIARRLKWSRENTHEYGLYQRIPIGWILEKRELSQEETGIDNAKTSIK